MEFRKMVTMTLESYMRVIYASYMRVSKRDTDVKNRLLDSVGEGEAGMM